MIKSTRKPNRIEKWILNEFLRLLKGALAKWNAPLANIYDKCFFCYHAIDIKYSIYSNYTRDEFDVINGCEFCLISEKLCDVNNTQKSLVDKLFAIMSEDTIHTNCQLVNSAKKLHPVEYNAIIIELNRLIMKTTQILNL